MGIMIIRLLKIYYNNTRYKETLYIEAKADSEDMHIVATYSKIIVKIVVFCKEEHIIRIKGALGHPLAKVFLLVPVAIYFLCFIIFQIISLAMVMIAELLRVISVISTELDLTVALDTRKVNRPSSSNPYPQGRYLSPNPPIHTPHTYSQQLS